MKGSYSRWKDLTTHIACPCREKLKTGVLRDNGKVSGVERREETKREDDRQSGVMAWRKSCIRHASQLVPDSGL